MAYLFQNLILETLFMTHKNDQKMYISRAYMLCDEDETLLQGTLLIRTLSC